MKGTKNVCKFLEDISKGARFYKAAALQPMCLVKRTLLLKTILKLFHQNSNNTYAVQRNSSRGVFRTQSHIYDGGFMQKEAISNFFINA